MEQLNNHPILSEIARCESGSRQFHEDGSTLNGRINPKDRGILQISETYWLETAQELGYNLETLDGNIQMGFYIYDNYGASPWYLSESCWSLAVK